MVLDKEQITHSTVDRSVASILVVIVVAQARNDFDHLAHEARFVHKVAEHAEAPSGER